LGAPFNKQEVHHDEDQFTTSTVEAVARSLPDEPVFLFRPHRLLKAAQWFSNNFPGDTFYAVKANPSPHVIRELWRGGVRGFDVASLCEVQLVKSLFANAKLAFMHPIKNFNVISRAYFEYGVRRFVLDSHEELKKIVLATKGATDLTLIVRFSVSNFGSTLPLSGKFGVHADEAPSLLRACRDVAQAMGISFHVGSQSLAPIAYQCALEKVAASISSSIVLQESEGGRPITIEVVDVGGGFPSVYDMDTPPPLEDYLDAIKCAIGSCSVFSKSKLWCEPGRALAAEGEGLLTRIEGTKRGLEGDAGDMLYLNDGSFGALYDSVHEKWCYPVRAVRASGEIQASDSKDLVPYTLYGPTCDSADKFPDAVMLPAGLKEGDYLEWGNIGAYGRCMATSFNGFGNYDTVKVEDSPWPSLYNAEALVEPSGLTLSEETLSAMSYFRKLSEETDVSPLDAVFIALREEEAQSSASYNESDIVSVDTDVTPSRDEENIFEEILQLGIMC
jgi:ornithine decarboxylase